MVKAFRLNTNQQASTSQPQLVDSESSILPRELPVFALSLESAF
jgi:hypothetical protein